MPDIETKPEILIIGAGPGGSAAAWALANAGHDVLMIDKTEFPRDKTCGDGLPPMAVKTLHEMDLIDKVLAAGACRIDYVRIKGMLNAQAYMAIKDFKKADAEYALTIPRYRFDDIVRQHALQAGAQFAAKVKVVGLKYDGETIVAVNAKTKDGPVRFEPKHVIIAVGAHLGLLKTINVEVKKKQMLLAARGYYKNFETDRLYYDFYFDMNLMPGYGWIFPSDDGTANIGVGSRDVWWNNTDTMRAEVAKFIERRQQQGSLPAELELIDAVKGFPIRHDFQDHPIAGENWVTIGEAAGLVNPLTGEGIDLAMISGLIAARTMHDDILKQRADHVAYQREVWEEFGPMFAGLSVLRNIIVNPVLLEYTIWLASQHKAIAKAVNEVAQGISPAQNVLHPNFVLHFLLPISPRWALEKIGLLAPKLN